METVEVDGLVVEVNIVHKANMIAWVDGDNINREMALL